MGDEDETAMRSGWKVRATVATTNGVREGDVGEIRRTALAEFHLVYWERRKCTSFYRANDLERIEE